MTDINPDRSVNCYFCSALIDERDCTIADDYNDNDGGVICGTCRDNPLVTDRVARCLGFAGTRSLLTALEECK